MSVDNQYSAPDGNFDSPLPPKKKSGLLKWILGGCGCLGLLTVCCFGGLIWFGLSSIDQVRQEAMGVIESSTVAQQQLGSPVTIEGERLSNGPAGSPIFEFDVSGPNGTGVVTATSEVDQQVGAFEISSYILDVDGQEFDLNVEDDFKMDIEGVDEF